MPTTACPWGRFSLEAGQPQETLDLSRRLNPQEAKTSQGLKLQALALDRLGDRQAALELLAGGLEDNPEDAELLAIAAALAAQGSYDRPLAITYYQRLYQLTRDPLVRRQLVDLLVSLTAFPKPFPSRKRKPPSSRTTRRPCISWPCSITGSGTTRRPARFISACWRRPPGTRPCAWKRLAMPRPLIYRWLPASIKTH